MFTKILVYSNKRLLLHVILECSNDYKLLDLFITSPEIIIMNLSNMTLYKDYEVKFLFYDIIYNYVNNIQIAEHKEFLYTDQEQKKIKDFLHALFLICKLVAWHKIEEDEKAEYYLVYQNTNNFENDKQLLKNLIKQYQYQNDILLYLKAIEYRLIELCTTSSQFNVRISTQEAIMFSKKLFEDRSMAKIIKLNKAPITLKKYLVDCTRFIGIIYDTKK